MMLKHLNARSRVIFWTDTGEAPKIERADYDGTKRQAIITTAMASPTALALDLPSQCCLATVCSSCECGGEN